MIYVTHETSNSYQDSHAQLDSASASRITSIQESNSVRHAIVVYLGRSLATGKVEWLS